MDGGRRSATQCARLLLCTGDPVMKMPRLISWSFAEGRLFDLWMVVHFMTGLTGGLSNAHLRLSTATLVLVGAALMILWEVLEWGAGVRESVENRVIDVLVGVAGIGVALQVARLSSDDGDRLAFRIALGATAALSAAGWAAYRRRRRRTPTAGSKDARESRRR